MSGMPDHQTNRNLPSLRIQRYGLPLFLLCTLLTGCSAFTSALNDATSSKQWLTMPVVTTNGEVKTRLTPPPNSAARERAIIGDESAILLEAVQWYAYGTVNCVGPADITRTLEYDPATKKIKLEVTTKNSDWLKGMFTGLWNTASGTLGFIGQVAGGAGNKL